jgi:hypothetical protein
MIERKFTSQTAAQDYEKSIKAQGFVTSLLWDQKTGIFTVKGQRRLI